MANEVKKGKIFERIANIMAKVDSIAKERVNENQGYKFRGIDDVYEALHDLMAQERVFSVPEVLEETRETIPSRSGGVLIYTTVRVKYTFYTDDGSSIETTVRGEGMDAGDKSGNKAMSIAHKYALLQIFAIPTDEPKDSENDSPEIAGMPQPMERTVQERNFVPMTDKQEQLINNLLRQRNLEPDEYLKSKNIDVEKLSVQEASQIIDRLLNAEK